jgi:hypothetical protein
LLGNLNSQGTQRDNRVGHARRHCG